MPTSRLRFRVPVLGGLNEQGRPDLIADGELQECLNYEVTRKGELHVRGIFEDYPHTLNFLDMNVITRIWVWKSSFMTEESELDYFLVVYSNQQRLWLLHYVGAEWIAVNDEPIFTDLDEPTITITENGLYLVDGRDNNIAKYIKVFWDGRVVYGDIGLAAPISLAECSGAGVDNSFVPDESSDIGMAIRRGSIIFMAYTMVTEDGVESNPSPLFAYDDMNYLYLDEDMMPTQYWQRTVIYRLRALVSADSELLETVKYFNIYMGNTLYTEGLQARTELRMASRITIAQLEDENQYVSTTPFTGKEISYENDIACKGDDICYTGGVLFIANANQQIRFPFQFDHYFKITLGNRNSRNYTNGAFWIRINETDLKDLEGNQIIEFATLINGNTINADQLPKLRIFDGDLTTMLPVVYRYLGGSGHIDILVKVPYVAAQLDHPTYLCFGGEGVPDSLGGVAFNTAEYGEWRSILVALNIETPVLRPNRVRDNTADISISCEWHTPNTAYNRATLAHNLSFHNNVAWTEIVSPAPRELTRMLGVERIFNYPATNEEKHILVTSDNITGSGYFQTENDITVNFPKKGYASFWLRYLPATAGDYFDYRPIFSIEHSATRYIRIKVAQGYDWTQRFQIETRGSGGTHSEQITTDIRFLGTQIFIGISWDLDEKKITFYTWEQIYGERIAEIDIPATKLPLGNELNYNYVYQINRISYNLLGHFTQLYAERNTYYNNARYFRSIRTLQPHFPEEWLGYDETDGVQHNITIDRARQIAYDTRMGMVKFSSLGGRTFPDMNFVYTKGKVTRIIPAPQYLKEAGYLNCVLIFGSDWRQRLLLQGTPEGWNAQINEILMDEKHHFGLPESCKRALIMIMDTLYWISGNKLLKENSDGLAILNAPGGIEKVEIPYPEGSEEYMMWYNAIDNQLVIHIKEELIGIHQPIPQNPFNNEFDTV